jgi:heptosyltransferase-2
MNYLKELPSVQKRYINTFTGLISSSAITNEQINLNYLTEDITLKSPAQWLSEIKKNRKKIITILAGTKHFTKTYPPEMFAEVIRLIRTEEYQIILTGNDADRKNAGIIKEHCGNEVLDLCGKLSLTELFLILQLSTFVIGGDTGPMHIAEALNIPLIMLAGSSVREFGFYPQSDNAVILENENLKCRPCSHIGKSICKERHFRCMRDIKPEMIYKEFLISQQKHR